jgi:hypothetical protein
MIRVAFLDDSSWFKDFALRYLQQLVPVEVVVPQSSDERLDLVFWGDGKRGEHRRFPEAKTVSVTCENLYPNFSKADYLVSCRYLQHPRYLRVPFWAALFPAERFLKSSSFAEEVLKQKREFCAFVQSNRNPRRTRKRLQFFNALHRRRFVHSGGAVQNNIGHRVGDLHEFVKGFRFYMAFENARFKGYTTEKLATGMLNGAIPIYWGDPWVDRDLNPESFIDVSRFATDSLAIDHIERVADSEDLQRRYLEAPFFRQNQLPALFDPQRVLPFFERMLEEPKPRRPLFKVRPLLDKLRHRLFPG